MVVGVRLSYTWVDPEGEQGVRNPLKITLYGFLVILVRIPENHRATKPGFNMGQYRWQANNQTLLVVFGASPPPPKKKKTQKTLPDLDPL